MPEDYPEAMIEFYENSGIKLLSHGLEGNKWPFKDINYEELLLTLRYFQKDMIK